MPNSEVLSQKVIPVAVNENDETVDLERASAQAELVEMLSTAATRELEAKNSQLLAQLEAAEVNFDKLKAEYEERLDSLSGQVILLSSSLIAAQNYSAGAISAVLYENPQPDRFAILADVVWLLRRVMKIGPVNAARKLKEYFYLKNSNRFDFRFYAAQISQKGLNAQRLLRHYVSEGFANGFDPSPEFSVHDYLTAYPDIKKSGVDPYTHYLTIGQRECRIAMRSTALVLDTPCDSISRVYAPSVPVQEPVVAETVEIEDRTPHWWVASEDPQRDRSDYGLYDFRPEDAVLAEAARGNAFMDQFQLLSEAPDFAGAVAALNALSPKSRITTGGKGRVDASIIIPIYGQLSYTLNALHSLLLHESRYSFEIIIGDDQSPDESGVWLPKIKRIQHVLHEVNGGFILNCNRTSKRARGETIIMLNNDVRVVPGWLDEIISSFEQFPRAGLIGSKLFYPDGILQEAGAIVWQDGSAWNYGRGDDPNRPRYCYARQVDYISGCAIAIPMTLWREMDGFDPHFTPAYYEDVDLCFRIREAGYETWMQPLSRVIHYEGKTSGIDTGQGVKAYQVANKVKLFERWQERLASHRPNAQEPWLERERKVSKRVLVIDACNPTPKQDAGSVSIINLFRYYQANDYHVSFLPEDNFLYQPEEVSEIQRTGVQCFYAPFEMSISKLLQKYGSLFDIIHIIRADVAYKCLDAVRTYAPNARLIYQNSDLHFLRMQRQAAVENRPDMLEDAEAMKTKELFITRSFDVTIVHSDVEMGILKQELPHSHTMVMPLIETVVSSKAKFKTRRDIMFLGGYNHPPNVDAALWLINDIWPALSKALPEARLLLVGAKPPKSILDKASDRIIVTGMVDKLAPWFDHSRVFLAALRFGAGSKGKVLASMAHGVPVICTDIAAEGLPLEDGKNVIMANSVEDIISKTLALYNLPEAEWNEFSKSSKEYIVKNHSFDTGVDLLKTAIKLAKGV